MEHVKPQSTDKVDVDCNIIFQFAPPTRKSPNFDTDIFKLISGLIKQHPHEFGGVARPSRSTPLHHLTYIYTYNIFLITYEFYSYPNRPINSREKDRGSCPSNVILLPTSNHHRSCFYNPIKPLHTSVQVGSIWAP